MRFHTLLISLALAINAVAQTGTAVKSADKIGQAQVEKLCGCFNVEFKYAETFSPDTAYKYHDREEISGGTELVFPVEVSDKRIVMQHLLVITDSIIVKHWREDWTYENPEIWKFKGDNIWVKEKVDPRLVKGKWTQAVWEVSDAPRYQGFSEWISTDNKTVWENTVDAPLPRREYSIRHDYNILRRGNRLILTENGYRHEQDNQKIIRNNGVDKLLVEEKGLNTYVRINAASCAGGKAYWEKTKDYWTSVRKTWEDYLTTHNKIELRKSVDGKPMHDFLFTMAKEYAGGKLKPLEASSRLKTLFEKFLVADSTQTVGSH